MADETGFHVKSNIFPTNTPEVAAANARHLALWNAIAEHHRVLAEGESPCFYSTPYVTI